MSREEDLSVGGGTRPGVAPEMLPCPECRGEMVEGWVPERIGRGADFSVPKWQPGPPRFRKFNFLVGIMAGTTSAPEYTEKALPISAYRCVRCGYLKFYARAAG